MWRLANLVAALDFDQCVQVGIGQPLGKMAHGEQNLAMEQEKLQENDKANQYQRLGGQDSRLAQQPLSDVRFGISGQNRVAPLGVNLFMNNPALGILAHLLDLVRGELFSLKNRTAGGLEQRYESVVQNHRILNAFAQSVNRVQPVAGVPGAGQLALGIQHRNVTGGVGYAQNVHHAIE